MILQPFKMMTWALFPAAVGLMVGCVTPALAKAKGGRTSTGEHAEIPMTGTARVAGSWQEKLIERLNGEKWDEAWGLFSEGGWSDAGQVMLLASADRSRSLLLIVSPNAKDKAAEKSLSKTKLDSLTSTFERAASLADVNEDMFDGLIYEYVHLKRDPEKRLKEGKRVYIKATGRIPHKEHEALVKTFEELKGEAG
jgi:hypothetical protein